MPRGKNNNYKRVELWLTTREINFINRHYADDKLKAKAWMENVIRSKINKRRSMQKMLSM